MAEEATPQGNIRQEFNNATVGLNLDQTLNQIKPGTLTYALNAAVENFDASSINYQNEQGNEFCLQFPENYVLIGTYFISEKSKHIFFLVNPNSDAYGCEIGYMDNADCNYHTLVSATCLNFQVNHPIHKVVHRITNCTTEIYWTDGLNSRRYLDIDNIPWKLIDGTPLCDPVYDIGNLDCNQLKLQPNFDIPQLEVVDIPTGGDITSGVYQFAAQYSDASGNGYTSYYSVTNPTPIADTQITSRDFNYPVGKSIVVDVSHLDLTGQFQYFNLAVIKTVNAITSVELVGTYFIEGINRRVTYTGQIVDSIRLSINDIFEKYPYYDVAEDLTTAQDILIWDGLKSNERISYQKIANQVSLLWETYKIPKEENYSDELNATNLRGYLRDEVYAFELVFLLDNGMQTDGFHIPGRASVPLDLTPVYITNPDFIGDPIDGEDYNYYWTVYNTATLLGTATEENIGNASAYQYGTFSYWESKEEYPCEVDIWGELAGTPIRHHKFPDVLVSPIYEAKTFTGVNSMVMGNNNVFPIGVRLDVDQIKSLIASSDLTQYQKDSIVGFKIVRGDRSTNKSIVGKGILRNVGQYTRESQNYYYPNYPYNDLKQDPFLNSVNNAWTQEAEPYVVNVLKMEQSDELGPYLEIEYTDVNINKTTKEKLRQLGPITICSLTKPIILSPGMRNNIYYNNDSEYPIIDPGNIATVNYKNYDIWQLRSIDPNFGDRCGGYTVEWSDYMSDDPETVYVGGSFFGEAPRTRYIYVKADTGFNCIEFCDRCGRRESLTQIRVDECKAETPQPAINNNTDLAYRQIFNSPETSFGKPFVGSGQVLKLENVMFGKGLAHFVEVKDNAKYRLLTKEAQEDALTSSVNIAKTTNPFSASAMFAAYQSYLTIYINGITRRNYAYSFNSIADYNYSRNILNGQGVKQRTLKVAKYLIPGVQSTGIQIDDYPINNYQRESSIYLKTNEYREDDITTITSLPFPDKSPEMVVAGTSIITERSRFTISESNSCAIPAKEQGIEVVSYYASLKNISVSQWGQIYSYQTIDTGFQQILKDSSGIKVVFGGDTFISRFAFKTKLPFFIDNRVNAPDDSDIFYDEIGNIAYPKFWHSARSILEDYNVVSVNDAPKTAMSNIISYKAHNFDCPNNQLPAPPTTNPGRTFYDGYFYLFAYGVPNFYCESSYNIDLRQAYDNRAGDFWPHVSNNIPDDWVQENYVSIVNDNTYTYNTTFSKQNKENTFLHLPPDFEPGNKCFTEYPFRAIYSDLQSTDADNRVNNWLIYRALSYFDFPQNYGNLISLDGIQNKAILARFDNKSLMYNNLLTVDTSNPQAAYLGNPNLFRGAPPIDFAETDLGYVGSQNKFLLKIPNGQITIDAKRGQVFLVVGTQAQDMSASGSGMNRFFTDHLAFEILRYFPEVDTDNHFNGVGLHGVFDTKFDRVIITKLDYIPLSNNISYDANLKEYFIEENNIQRQIYLTDTEYFCNKSWTLSFNFNTKSWTSFHSYIPNFYIGENNFFYSGLNGCCDEFDFVVGPLVPGPTTTTTTTRLLNCTIAGTARIPNCNLNGNAIEVTTTTTTTIPPSTTTTTTLPLSCNEILVTTSSSIIVRVNYIDCGGIPRILEVGGSTGITSINICISSLTGYDDGIVITLVGVCNITTTTTTLPPTTTTTTTTILTCNAPTLSSPFISSGNINVNITYNGGAACGTLLFESSTNNINWSSNAGGCVSTFVVGAVPSVTTYYRAKIFCSGVPSSPYSNTVVYVPPTTTTTTSSSTSTSTTTSTTTLPTTTTSTTTLPTTTTSTTTLPTTTTTTTTLNCNLAGTAEFVYCNSYRSAPYDTSLTLTYINCSGVQVTTTQTCSSSICRYTVCATRIISSTETMTIIGSCNTTTTTTTTQPQTTTTTTTLPSVQCNGTSDAGGQGLKDLSVNLDPSGGVVVFLFNPDNFVDKLEIYHGTPQNGGVNKKSTTSMTATTNNNVFDNVWGTPPSNSLPNNVALPVDQFIGNSKGTAPTRQTQFTADTGFTIPSMTIGGSTYQQIIWWKYTSADYLTNNKATIRVTGGSNGTVWNSLRFCPPTTTTTTTLA